ncbi:hypothetical protein OIU84_000173 [Salix udensis]|uniref:Uncharacterized protein n=1 Tax=Salix udensis TaxID=889485 RepID=A0AAD6PMV2_9ROSI|nr:hypothetical protein OIU84_000173 [Salix udensis]
MARPVINECYSPTSLKSRLKSSFRCFPNTEMIDQHEILHQDYGQEGGDCMKLQPRTPRSLYAWLKSTVHDLEFKEKYRCSIGKRGKNRKRHCSEDFRYDPASYSLNFEDDVHKEDELPLYYNFKARLPATPERLVAVPPPVRRTELRLWS